MTTAILLAAGSSKRMGEQNKLLLPINGIPVISQIAKHLIESDIDNVVAVVGHQSAEVVTYLTEYHIEVALNTNHEMGMVSSIKSGITIIPKETTRIMIILGDMPLLTHAHFNELLIFAKKQKQNSIIRPISNNKELGHPVIFASRYLDEITNCQDPHTLKSIVKANKTAFMPFETEDRAYFTDMDTPSEYELLNL